MARQSGATPDSCGNDSSAGFRYDAVCSKNSDNPGMLSADELGIILLSLKVAGASVLFNLPLALGCALLLARGSFPKRHCLTRWCICRWCCRRW